MHGRPSGSMTSGTNTRDEVLVTLRTPTQIDAQMNYARFELPLVRARKKDGTGMTDALTQMTQPITMYRTTEVRTHHGPGIDSTSTETPVDAAQYHALKALTVQDTPPVKMPLGQVPITSVIGEDGHKLVRRFKARARDRLRSMPFLLEDQTKQNSYTGRIMKSCEPEYVGQDQMLSEPQSALYYFMVEETPGQFTVYPSGDWLSFKPKIKHHVLSLEEAEEKLKVKGKSRFAGRLAKKPDEEGKDDDDKDEHGAFAFNVFGSSAGFELEEEEEGGTEAERSKAKKAKEKAQIKLEKGEEEGETFDFEGEFDDDEGYDEYEARARVKEKKKTFSESGTKLKELIKEKEGDDDSDHEPDLSDDPDAESKVKKEESDAALKKEQEEAAAQAAIASAAAAAAAAKRKAPDTATTTTTTPAKKIKTEPVSEAAQIEDRVKRLLLRKGKVKGVRLLKRFEAEIGRIGKAEFLRIIGNIATITDTDGAKYVVLKPNLANAPIAPSKGKK
eukprot:TRINITY_DN5720_c0_g1_i1.p1 TRINITY_DN5720_c0_g1~~TRINITY_DN5720_c0_g1_i1.p1  ORF type:complete len:503 (+),score=125.35 TRINITY_DN5720_c0_g1_i1:135-1643(+)